MGVGVYVGMRDRRAKERGHKAVLSLIPSKGLPVSVLWHRVHRGKFPPHLGFFVQFITSATWSVRANPVTTQQKAKLRGTRGCRTGRLTG